MRQITIYTDTTDFTFRSWRYVPAPVMVFWTYCYVWYLTHARLTNTAALSAVANTVFWALMAIGWRY